MLSALSTVNTCNLQNCSLYNDLSFLRVVLKLHKYFLLYWQYNKLLSVMWQGSHHVSDRDKSIENDPLLDHWLYSNHSLFFSFSASSQSTRITLTSPPVSPVWQFVALSPSRRQNTVLIQKLCCMSLWVTRLFSRFVYFFWTIQKKVYK